MDASFIVNEYVAFMLRVKKEEVVLKLDFEKAYDRVNWRFDGHSGAHKAFGPKWRSMDDRVPVFCLSCGVSEWKSLAVVSGHSKDQMR